MGKEMTEIRFYHLTRKSTAQALPDLLEKTLSRGWRSLVLVKTEEEAETLSDFLWKDRPEAFLPHGTAKDGRAAAQPVWISNSPENPNNASVLFLLGGSEGADPSSFALVCELFDGLARAKPSIFLSRLSWSAAKIPPFRPLPASGMSLALCGQKAREQCLLGA